MYSIFTTLIEKSLNGALRLDPEAKKRLQPLNHKVLVIEAEDLHSSLILRFSSDDIRCLENYHGHVDARLVGRSISLILMSFSKNPSGALQASDIKIIGETEVIHLASQLFKELHIDWEEVLSARVGDTIAHRVGNFVRNALSFTRQIHSTLQQNLAEYLQEELKYFPSAEEANDVMNEIDQLRDDIDRLQARIDRLRKSPGE